MNKYPHLFLSLSLSLALIVPFTLKIRYGLEPYPAIILPSGAYKADAGAEEVSFYRLSLWGNNEKENAWKRVDLEAFLAPIPPHFLSAIVHNSLGLKQSEGKIIKLPKGIKVLGKKIVFSEVQDAKDWWSKKLIWFGYASDKIMITKEQIRFNTETEQIIQIERIDEQIIQLN